MRVASVVGARPNLIKLAPVHQVIRESVEHTIIHTGQHYDYQLSEVFFKEFSLPTPNYNLEVGSGTQGYQIAQMIERLEKIFLTNRYDLVLVYGDTNSTFAGAIAANRAGIKTAHIESGLRSYDRRMPEEINRILTDNICDYLFAPTPSSVANLHREHVFGEIHMTGDLSVEIIKDAQKKLGQSQVLNQLDLSPKSYLLFTLHRAENTNSPDNLRAMLRVFEMLNDVVIVFPIHPRTKKVLNENGLYSKLLSLKNVKIVEPLGFLDFVKLVKFSSKVVTDSGGVQKESYLMRVPCITIRKSTEWIETVKAGWNRVTDTDERQIIRACRSWRPSRPHIQIFGNGRTSMAIKKVILRLNERE